MADPQTTDPYAATAIKAAPAQDPYAATAIKPTAQAPKTAPPPPAPEGFFHSLGSAFGITTEAAQQRQQEMDQHPIRTILKDALLGPALPFAQGLVNQGKQTMGEISQAVQQGQKGDAAGLGTHLLNAVPIGGPLMTKASTNAPVSTGNYWQDVRNAATDPSTMGTLLGMSAQLAPMAEGPLKAMRATKPLGAVASAISDAPRRLIAGDVLKPITGQSDLTPQQRYNSAKNLGVNLNAADATNHTPLKVVKSLGENSLLGAPAYDASRAANMGALNGSTGDFLDSLYQGDRQNGGSAIQNALKSNQSGLQSRSTEGFEALPQDIPLPGLEDVGKRAQQMGEDNEAYQDLFPSLKPTRAMGVVGDVAGLGPQSNPPIRMSPFVSESGEQIPSSAQPEPRPLQSFGTGQKLRSDLLEFGRNNPDIVAGHGDDMVRELAGGVDDALAGGSSQLTPAQLQTFRDANAAWRDMKETYDDPSSPLYHAVRSDDPSLLYNGQGLGPKTPENAFDLKQRLTPFKAPSSAPFSTLAAQPSDSLSPALGALRRGTIEGALKTTNDGSPNFKTFGTQLNRIPADYRAELFTTDQNSRLRDIANTSNLLGQDSNPSGSAKLGQKVVEGASLFHPATMAAPLFQYPAARLMNSPAFVDWLMTPNAKPMAAPNPFIGVAAAANASKQQ